MAFNISSFKSSFIDGGARPTLFDITLQFPTTLGDDANEVSGTDASRKLTFTCRAASIPESRMASINVPYFGRSIKVEGNRDYPDWRVIVMNDEDFTVRQALEAWHGNINSVIPNRMNPNLWVDGSYKQTALIKQYRKAGADGGVTGNSGEDVIRTYTMEGIFPVNIGDIRLGWQQVNEIEEYQVDFAYDWWIPTIGEADTTTSSGITIGAVA